MFKVQEKFNGEPGIYKISAEEYHASPGISNSHLVNLQKTPLHYQTWLTEERKDSDEMRIGRAAHCLILEPNTFLNRYIVCPKVDKRTNAGKEIWAKIEAEAEGREIIPDWMCAQVENIKNHFEKKIERSPYGALFQGLVEYSFYWIQDGVLCKCRPDVITRAGIITDLKITSDASENEFQRSIAKFGYAMQAAWYLRGVIDTLTQTNSTLPEGYVIPDKFVIVPGEREKPYDFAMYELGAKSMIEGDFRCLSALEMFKQCEAKKDWPGYELAIKPIELPTWGFRGDK